MEAATSTAAASSALERVRPTRGRPTRDGREAVQWSDDMVDRLFQLRYQSLASWFEDTRKRRNQHEGWALLTAEIASEFAVNVTTDQCRGKIKSSKKRYIKLMKNSARGYFSQLELPLRFLATVKQYCGENPAWTANISSNLETGDENSETETASAPVQKPKRGRPSLYGEKSIYWEDNMMEKLIQLRYEALGSEFAISKGKDYRRYMWRMLSSQMSEALGVTVAPNQCSNKASSMERRWQQYLSHLLAGTGSTSNFGLPAEPRWVQVMRRYCGERIGPEDNEANGDGGEDAEEEVRVDKRRRPRVNSLMWGDEMTDKLFKLRFETMRPEFESCPNHIEALKLWEQVAIELTLTCGGPQFDLHQCRNKIKATNRRWEALKESFLQARAEGTSSLRLHYQPHWVKIYLRYCGGDDIELFDHLVEGEVLPTSRPQGRRAPIFGMNQSFVPTVPANNTPQGTRTTGLTSNGFLTTGESMSNSSSTTSNAILRQILRAVEQQRDATIQQTQSIQELLHFLRQERL